MAEVQNSHPLVAHLNLPRCPHCEIAEPYLKEQFRLANDGYSTGVRHWVVYECSVCKGLTTAWSGANNGPARQIFPGATEISEAVPVRPRGYLKQAKEALAQPAASIMVSASAVDSMLKQCDLSDGNLYHRIDKAAANHLITAGMAKWAHQVRLDANDQRHADETASLPTMEDAVRCFDFALALAEVLFVLPARVTQGITDTSD